MLDLFDKKQKKENSYEAKDIEVLEGLEPVRQRPGMYIGGTDKTALHHLASEIIDNSMDEAVAGYASIISITLKDNNKLCIRDNGRGIPVDNHPKRPKLSTLEVICTTLHSGGKFNSSKAYNTSGGLHGVGLSVVNALSEDLLIEVNREKYFLILKGNNININSIITGLISNKILCILLLVNKFIFENSALVVFNRFAQ
jgi:topoisomerase-4 subunit B